MYKLTRLILIASVVMIGWSIVVFTILAPGAWIVALIVLACMVGRRRYQLTAYGTARWADASDLGAMKDGPIVGRLDSRPPFLTGVKALFTPSVSSESACQQFFRKRTDLVRLSKCPHAAIFGPTGAGKGRSFVIPHLLTCPDSTVVVDFKGENARITAKARRAMGHRVVLLDPFKVVTDKPDTFNPLDFIDPNSPVAPDECRDLAEALVVRTGQEREPHWPDAAEMWIGGLIAAVVHFGQGSDKSLQAVRTLLSDPARIPEGQDQTLLSNVSATFFAINDNETAKYVSDRLGDASIIVSSGGTSTGTSHQRGEQGQRSTSYSENHSDNWQQIGRRLYRAEELMALDERIAISFMPGVPPIRTRLIRYYERDFCPGRLGRALTGFRMLAASAVILFVAAIVVGSIVGAVASRNTHRQPDIVNDPMWGVDQRSFERR